MSESRSAANLKSDAQVSGAFLKAREASQSVDSIHKTVDKLRPVSVYIEIQISSIESHSISLGDEYTLVVFGSADAQITAELTQSAPIRTATLTADLIEYTPVKMFYQLAWFPDKQNLAVPRFLHFALFLTARESADATAKVTCQLAQGSLLFRALLDENLTTGLTCALNDIEGVKQAEISVVLKPVSHNALARKCILQYCASYPTVEERGSGGADPKLRLNLINGVKNVFIEHAKRMRSDVAAQMAFFSYTSFHPVQLSTNSKGLIELPILAFVYGAGRVQMEKQQTEWFMWHMIAMAAANLGIAIKSDQEQAVKEFNALTATEKGDLLAETCTLYFRGLFYTHDVVRIGRGNETLGDKGVQTEESDQWSRLNFFPCTKATTGFDCEDGAEWMLEFLNLLKKGTFNEPLVCAMQSFAGLFTPFFMLGMLHARGANTQQSYVPHAYVALLDTASLIPGGFKVGTYNPAIVLESTTYTQGAWHVTRVKSALDKNTPAVELQCVDFLKRSAFISKCSSVEAVKRMWRKTCKVKACVSLITSQEMYGSVFAMVCASFPVGNGLVEARHFLLRDTSPSRPGLGVAPQHLFLYKGNVEFITAASVSQDRFSELDAMLRETPRVRMPAFRTAPHEKPYPVKKEDTDRILVRSCDLDDADNLACFTKALSLADSRAIKIYDVKVSMCGGISMRVCDVGL